MECMLIAQDLFPTKGLIILFLFIFKMWLS